MKGDLNMKRKDALNAAVKITAQLCHEYLKRVGLTSAAILVVLIAIALIKPDFYKDIDQK